MLSFKRNGAPFLWNGCAVFAEYAPMKIRVVDEDGESQNFVVQEYRILSGDKPHTLGNGVPVLGNQILTYELKIIVLGTAKWIKVMYNTRDMVWRKMSF